MISFYFHKAGKVAEKLRIDLVASSIFDRYRRSDPSLKSGTTLGCCNAEVWTGEEKRTCAWRKTSAEVAFCHTRIPPDRVPAHLDMKDGLIERPLARRDSRRGKSHGPVTLRPIEEAQTR